MKWLPSSEQVRLEVTFRRDKRVLAHETILGEFGKSLTLSRREDGENPGYVIQILPTRVLENDQGEKKAIKIAFNFYEVVHGTSTLLAKPSVITLDGGAAVMTEESAEKGKFEVEVLPFLVR